MRYDESRIDEAVLAILGAFECDNGRVWKRIDFEAMDRLHANGFITDPRGKRESVYLTPEGLDLAKRLAAELFTPLQAGANVRYRAQIEQSVPHRFDSRLWVVCGSSNSATTGNAAAAQLRPP